MAEAGGHQKGNFVRYEGQQAFCLLEESLTFVYFNHLKTKRCFREKDVEQEELGKVFKIMSPI